MPHDKVRTSHCVLAASLSELFNNRLDDQVSQIQPRDVIVAYKVLSWRGPRQGR